MERVGKDPGLRTKCHSIVTVITAAASIWLSRRKHCLHSYVHPLWQHLTFTSFCRVNWFNSQSERQRRKSSLIQPRWHSFAYQTSTSQKGNFLSSIFCNLMLLDAKGYSYLNANLMQIKNGMQINAHWNLKCKYGTRFPYCGVIFTMTFSDHISVQEIGCCNHWSEPRWVFYNGIRPCAWLLPTKCRPLC